MTVHRELQFISVIERMISVTNRNYHWIFPAFLSETLFSNFNLHFFCIISLKRPSEVNLNAWQLNHLAVGLFEYHFWLKHLWKWNIVLKKTAKIDLIISRLLWEFTCMSSRENFSQNKKAEVKAGFFAHCLFQKKMTGTEYVYQRVNKPTG